MSAYLPWLAILAGFIGLIWSADRFVNGSAAIACNLGIPKLLVGLTVVAFGTSAPEIVVSISSALKGAGDLAIGNAIGSNLANVGLVLGITILITALPVKSHILKQEVPILLAITALSGYLLYDGQMQRYEGIILVSLMIPLIAWLAYSHKQHPGEDEEIPEMPMSAATLWFIIGLVVLIASSESLVWGATKIALDLGISPLIIGLTVVAIGTSLPELAASVMSALKGHHDIAIGNVIGSNIFNLLLVMGIPTIISPISMDLAVFSRDYLSMALLTFVLAASMVIFFWSSKNRSVARPMGIALLIMYAGYYTLLF